MKIGYNEIMIISKWKNKYVIWYKVSYPRHLQEKKYGSESKNIEYRGTYKGTIPPEVTSLGAECFSNYKDLMTFMNPTTINKLGGSCFNGCKSLISINIPTTISNIGNRCFLWMYIISIN
ncbi:hypothetical protein ENUP19_0037G0006 [Entamoeba nuttalli]|uniref:Leucine rich repeat protein, BspA family protein n=1 Tax=Entamoeba nuttalli TaxID=412467 RepID=A0ABQ0D9F2_9EUKA